MAMATTSVDHGVSEKVQNLSGQRSPDGMEGGGEKTPMLDMMKEDLVGEKGFVIFTVCNLGKTLVCSKPGPEVGMSTYLVLKNRGDTPTGRPIFVKVIGEAASFGNDRYYYVCLS